MIIGLGLFMRKTLINYNFYFLLILGLAIALAGCEKPIISLDPTPKLKEIQVTCEQNRAPRMVYLPCEAVGLYSDGSRQYVTYQAKWTSSDSAIIESSNTTHPSWVRGIAAGRSEVLATIDHIKGSFGIEVTSATPVSMAVAPANQIFHTGAQQQFTSICVFSDNTFFDVTFSANWRSLNSSVATPLRDTENFAKVKSLAAGTTMIEAEFEGVTGSTLITVLDKELLAIEIGPASSTVIRGLETSFTATGIYTDLSTEDITNEAVWSIFDGTIAAIGNIGANKGKLTALQAGTTKIFISYGGYTDMADVVVINPILNALELLPADPSFPKGFNKQMQALGRYSDGSTIDVSDYVIWTSSDSGIVTASNVSGQKGKLFGVNVGTGTISATLDNIVGQTTATVTAATLMSIAVTPSSPTVPHGTIQALTATGTYSDGTTVDLTSTANWNSGTPAHATVGNSGGTKGVVSTVALGTTIISASIGSVVGQTTVTVTTPALTSIAVTPTNDSVAKGLTLQYVAMGTYSDGSSSDITSAVNWASASSSVATISMTAGSKGLATGAGVGTSTISATLGNVVGQTTLTITAPILASITLTPSAPSVPLGTTQVITATGTYSDGTTADVTSSATWNSGTPSHATVSDIGGSKGTVSPVTLGTSTISATIGSVVGQTTVTVAAAALLSIAVTPNSPSIPLGTTQVMTATGTYSDGTTADLTSSATWNSGTPSQATVSNSGGSKGTVSTVAQGTSIISATVGSVVGQMTITVSAPILASIAITPSLPSIPLGTTQALTAMGTYSDGTTSNLASTANWNSATPAHATVGNSGGSKGVVSTVALGTSIISATIGSVVGQTTVTVAAPLLMSIVVTPANNSVVKGLTLQYIAMGTYSDGSSGDITSAVNWASTSPSVATISITAGSKGLATGAGTGTSTISATVGSIVGQATITVTPAVLVSVTVTPANYTMALLETVYYTATGTYTDGTTENITTLVTWHSSNGSTVGISNSPGHQGEAAGLGLGSSTITATTTGGIVGSTILNGPL